MGSAQWTKSVLRFDMKLHLVIALLAAGPFTLLAQAPPKPAPGLAVTFKSGTITDTDTTPNVWLYVAAGQPATPFVPAGPFTAEWRGVVNADLRGDYAFEAELNGAVKVELNDALVLEGAAKNGVTPRSKTIRLSKGANALKVTFTSPAQGDAYLRLHWSDKPDKPVPSEPIPSAQLGHLPSVETARGAQLRLGRELFLDYRCAKCHAGPAVAVTAAPELAMDAPSFDGIGGRRHFAWLKEWILNPQAQRPGAQMPKMFHGPTAEKDAEAAAAYLASLNAGGAVASFLAPYKAVTAVANAAESPAAQQDEGKNLLEKLHCNACHNLPGEKADAKKLSLDHLTRKFPGGKLVEFLRAPERHYAWTQMPNFRLTAEEANEVAKLLLEKLPMFKLPGPPSDPSVAARGKKLVASTGCLNCHTAPYTQTEFAAKPLTQITAAKWTGGCLAEQPAAGSKAPHFRFTAAEHAALSAFAATDRKSLERHVPIEFAARQVRTLNCTGCHGQVEGFPALDIVGGKLKPEWSRELLAGTLLDRPRPWLSARMPAFPRRAEWLASGLAQTHGLPPKTPAEPALKMELAQTGQKLAGVDGGFSCISCHGVAGLAPTQVFEAPGINLAFSAARLQPAYYRRWLLNPQRLDPQTKMPVYFDEEGKSPLAEVLGGDAAKQLDALWHYLRLGEKMPPPATQ